ncbi:glycosyltransferase involved in cell wall biosynthesis [Hydrogenivirga caldilitoris]|uniref:Glycosyltransferase involved in cell wall biosynthesis n=1 Tax=Hydrogenivirga caldilitoris TaxID=246264 RepID=A0A497XR86_9AQUI|nr:glycosyltransferase family 2 protein [Hydrogenivirga caldilitoris]RLJ71505.1 glycosyltransferase involved in cell wall biosynthesis [Hydrogenivirga caldilitoris]
MNRFTLSVAIITYNEEDIIGKTLESVKDIASEIVVVDSGSTDRTREIAESYGAKVYIEEWKGYAAQKNSALEKCTQEWVLFLDADEVVSEELRRSIIEELKNPKAEGYLINRRTYYLGKFLKYAWQPEWRLRLVRKEVDPIWESEPHEFLKIKSENIAKLEGDIYHYSYRSLRHQAEKGISFAIDAAVVKYSKGKKVSAVDIVFRPFWAFFRELFFKRAFLEGYRGIIISFMASFYTFLKYAFLFELEMKEKEGKNLWGR